MTAGKRVVIKLSGSVFGTGEEAARSLEAHAASLKRLCRSFQPVVVAGGGAIARHYIGRARAAGADESTLDELGIGASRLNARLLIAAMGDAAHRDPPATLREVRAAADGGLAVVAGGLQPGQSTNGTAALIAERTGASMFINATDVDGVYDMDPNEHPGARLLPRVPLGDLRRMLAGADMSAGGYDLMDLLALKIIERSRISTRIMKADPRAVERAARGARPAPGTLVVLPARGRP